MKLLPFESFSLYYLFLPFFVSNVGDGRKLVSIRKPRIHLPSQRHQYGCENAIHLTEPLNSDTQK